MFVQDSIRRLAFRVGFNVGDVKFDLGDDPYSAIRELTGLLPIKTIVDVGAFEGQTTLQLNSEFPNATIYSIEPYIDAFKKLEKCTKEFPNIHPCNIALSDDGGIRELYIRNKKAGNSLLKNSDEIDEHIVPHTCDITGKQDVSVWRLSSFCNHHNIKTIDILKLDAQGCELDILEGASMLLRTSVIRFVYLEVLFVSLYKDQGYFEDILKIMRHSGYRLFSLYDIHNDREGIKWADALFYGGYC